MKKPDVLYHGGPRPLEGAYLMPSQPRDTNDDPNNLHYGIYATPVRLVAVAAPIVMGPGVKDGCLSMSEEPPHAIIYDGLPLIEKLFLYTLPSDSFFPTQNEMQWVSSAPVKPLDVEELKLKDHQNIIWKCTPAEFDKWLEDQGYRK